MGMSAHPPLDADPSQTRLWELTRRAQLSERMGERHTLESITEELFLDLTSIGAIHSVCLLRLRKIPEKANGQRNGEMHDDATVYRRELVVEAASAESLDLIGQRVPWGEHITGRAAASNQQEVCDNIEDAPARTYLSTPERPNRGSEIAIPLFDGDGRLLGIVEAQSHTPYAFTSWLKGYIGQQGRVLAHHLIGIEKNERCTLTGVYNSTVFRRLLELEIASALRKEGNLSVVELDLDLFKPVNDVCGHHEGDKVLHRFGETIREASRQSDFIVRTGGDEFHIIMPYTCYDDAKQVAARLRQTVTSRIELKYPPLQERLGTEEPLYLTFSYGVASLCHALNELSGTSRGAFLPPTSENVATLFDMLHSHADERMYAMKHALAPEQQP